MDSNEAGSTPRTAAPALLDVVTVLGGTEPHHRRPGMVIDVLRLHRSTNGDRYRVRFGGGVTEWHWADELIVQPWANHRDAVLTDLAAVRTILHHAIVAANGHELLSAALGYLFDAVTTTTTTYLGVPLDDAPITGSLTTVS